MVKNKHKQARAAALARNQPIQSWFNIAPPRAKAPIFRIGATAFMDKKPTLSALWIPQRMESNKWLPMVQTPRRPVSFFWGDSDNDGVYNGLDCEPFNPWKQGKIHDVDDLSDKMSTEKARAEAWEKVSSKYKERERARLEKKQYERKDSPARFRTDEELKKLAKSKKKDIPFAGTYIHRKINQIKVDPNLPIGKLAQPYHPHRYEGGKKEIGYETTLSGMERKIITKSEPSKQYQKDIELERKRKIEEEALEQQLKEYGVPDKKGIILDPKKKKHFYDKDRLSRIKDIILTERKYNRGLDKFNELEKEKAKQFTINEYETKGFNPNEIIHKRIKKEFKEQFFKNLPEIREQLRKNEKTRKAEFYAKLKLGDNPNYVPADKLPISDWQIKFKADDINKYAPEKSISQLTKEEIIALGEKDIDPNIRLRRLSSPKTDEERVVRATKKSKIRDDDEDDEPISIGLTDEERKNISSLNQEAEEEEPEEDYDLSELTINDKRLEKEEK